VITFKDFLAESINDKGLFKAIFVVGTPGAGKSYTIKKLHGPVSPRVVNIDRATEFIRKKTNKQINDPSEREEQKKWQVTGPRAKRLTKIMLAQYIVNMLPLFIDCTTANPQQVLKRAKLLHDFGYDVGLVLLHVSPETAKKRIVDRVTSDNDRTVDPKHVDRAYENLPAVQKIFKEENFEYFREYSTESTGFDNDTLEGLFKSTQKFFASPVKNPKGVKAIETLESLEARVAGNKYLVPTIISQIEVDTAVDDWFPERER
jgi:predicted kinase